MEYELIIFEEDYADEFDLYGFKVMEKGEFQKMVDNLPDFKNKEWYFGTNEYVTYYSKKDFLRSFKVVEIPTLTVGILSKYFGKSFGHFPELVFEEQ